jgi:hypothetical protein
VRSALVFARRLNSFNAIPFDSVRYFHSAEFDHSCREFHSLFLSLFESVEPEPSFEIQQQLTLNATALQEAVARAGPWVAECARHAFDHCSSCFERLVDVPSMRSPSVRPVFDELARVEAVFLGDWDLVPDFAAAVEKFKADAHIGTLFKSLIHRKDWKAVEEILEELKSGHRSMTVACNIARDWTEFHRQYGIASGALKTDPAVGMELDATRGDFQARFLLQLTRIDQPPGSFSDRLRDNGEGRLASASAEGSEEGKNDGRVVESTGARCGVPVETVRLPEYAEDSLTPGESVGSGTDRDSPPAPADSIDLLVTPNMSGAVHSVGEPNSDLRAMPAMDSPLEPGCGPLLIDGTAERPFQPKTVGFAVFIESARGFIPKLGSVRESPFVKIQGLGPTSAANEERRRLCDRWVQRYSRDRDAWIILNEHQCDPGATAVLLTDTDAWVDCCLRYAKDVVGESWGWLERQNSIECDLPAIFIAEFERTDGGIPNFARLIEDFVSSHQRQLDRKTIQTLSALQAFHDDFVLVCDIRRSFFALQCVFSRAENVLEEAPWRINPNLGSSLIFSNDDDPIPVDTDELPGSDDSPVPEVPFVPDEEVPIDGVSEEAVPGLGQPDPTPLAEVDEVTLEPPMVNHPAHRFLQRVDSNGLRLTVGVVVGVAALAAFATWRTRRR